MPKDSQHDSASRDASAANSGNGQGRHRRPSITHDNLKIQATQIYHRVAQQARDLKSSPLAAKVSERADAVRTSVSERADAVRTSQFAVTLGKQLQTARSSRLAVKLSAQARAVRANPVIARPLNAMRLALSGPGDSRFMWRGIAGLGALAIVALGFLAAPAPTPPSSTDVAVATGTESDRATEEQAGRSSERDQQAEAPPEADAEAKAEPEAKPEAEAEDKPNPNPKPVAGLNERQMEIAVTVVEVGREMGISEQGQAVALITAMQESKMQNYASHVLPESLEYPYDAIGSDFDSVGVFQQRPSMGWGSVKEIMNVEYATETFYKALLNVDGWEKMAMTVAAQTVQGSAFPDAYAQWEDLAWAVIEETK